nr:hypothetical protein CFP56_10730 [Quercus suber]
MPIWGLAETKWRSALVTAQTRTGMSWKVSECAGHETWDKGNPEMFGMNSDSGDKISKKHGPTDMDMEVLDIGWEDDSYPSLILKDQDNVADSNLKRNNEVTVDDNVQTEEQSGHETWDKGNPEMFGMNSDSGDKISKKHGPTDMDMEVLDIGWEDDSYPSLILKDQDNVVDSNLKRNNEVSSV